MKTSIKTFAYTAVASIAFLACNDTGLNPGAGDDSNISATKDGGAKQPPTPYVIVDPDYCCPHPDLPNICMLPKLGCIPSACAGEVCTADCPRADYMCPRYDFDQGVVYADVRYWMSEQIKFKGSEKRRIVISDVYLLNIYSGVGLSTATESNGNVKYFLKGKEISAEEYKGIQEEIKRNAPKRDLPIPGEILSYENNSFTWTVLMTAEKLDELLSKGYYHLLIRFEEDVLMPMND